MAYPQFGSLGSLSGARPVRWGGQPPMQGQMPQPPMNQPMPVHPAWGNNPPFGGGIMMPGQGGIQPPWGGQPPVWGGQPVHPAWGINPPHFGVGAEGLQNHLASLRQMNSPARFQNFMNQRY